MTEPTEQPPKPHTHSSDRSPVDKTLAKEQSLLDKDMAELARRNPGRFWLLLAVFAGLGLMVLSAFRQGWFTPTEYLYVQLPSVTGVSIGTAVKLKGFKIGEVDEITLEPNLNVKVRLKVVQERMAMLSADAAAKFGRDGPISGKFIDILPGTRPIDTSGKGALSGATFKPLAPNSTLSMDSGGELEDVMANVKIAVEKLASAIGKVEPILDDTKKLTGEAAAMRQDIRGAITKILADAQSMSGELKRVGASASTVAGKVDGDRAALVADIRRILAQSEAASVSAKAALKALELDLPQVLDKTKSSLDNVRDVTSKAQDISTNVRQTTADVKAITGEARQDIPPMLRNARSATQNSADITQGIKESWPINSLIKAPEDPALPLDGFEGKAK